MQIPKDVKLTKNFSLNELLFGKAMPHEAIQLAIEHLTNDVIDNYVAFAPEMQKIRDYVNNKFKSDIRANTDITIIINAGYRPVVWEKAMGRSGDSQHTICAVDFTFGNVSDELSEKITYDVYKKYDNEKWLGGLAIKKPKNKLRGFIHLDPRKPNKEHIKRGYGARWEYK